MSSARILAFVALNSPAEPDGQELAARVKSRFADALNIPVSAQPDQTGGALLIDMGGVLVTVMSIDRPMPPDAYHRGLELNHRWEDAPAAMQAHKAHFIVATLSEVDGYNEALNGTICVSLVAAALAESSDSVGVMWSTGQALTEAGLFVSEIEGLKTPEIPALVWVSLDVYRGEPTSNGEPTFTMYTTGLRPFVGRELEFAPTVASPNELATRMIGTSQYLIQNGLVLADGDTLGVSEQERIRARYMDPGARPGIPAIRLILEHLDR